MFIFTISSGELKADNSPGTKKLRDHGVFGKGKKNKKIIVSSCVVSIFIIIFYLLNSINICILKFISSCILGLIMICFISAKVNQEKRSRLP